MKYFNLQTTQAQCIEKEKAATKLVDEGSQKIVALLGEVEQVKADVAREKELDAEYQTEYVSKDSKLAQTKTALAMSERLRQNTYGTTCTVEAKTKRVEAKLEKTLQELKASKGIPMCN
ncbi:hypothetical protein NE237_026659 [Protea cynaroides]|uniref:Uncharacterized protein n=1 Tax=Protea cynaroides TaxID=273540 RepID=A0A9Q0H4N7_9MAGN|nr:hypothetical protein NE237_026659 [Protea cynaroides]